MITMISALLFVLAAESSRTPLYLSIGGLIGGVAALITAFSTRRSNRDNTDITKFDKLTTKMDQFTARIASDNEQLRANQAKCNEEITRLRKEKDAEILELKRAHAQEMREMRGRIEAQASEIRQLKQQRST